MTGIRYVQPEDRDFWFRLDRHLPEAEFDRKVRDRQGYVLLEDGIPVGLLRWQLFWDNTPFCNLLFIDQSCRKKGYGRLLMTHWEADVRALGYGMAVLAAYRAYAQEMPLESYLQNVVFRDAESITVTPTEEEVAGFQRYLESYRQGLALEHCALENIK